MYNEEYKGGDNVTDKEILKRIFSTNLKKYMNLHEKSRSDICNDLGFNYFTVTDWVNGKKYPRMDKIEKLAKYFGILISDLIEEKKQEKSTENDGLTENQRILMDFAKSVPEEKVDLVLRVMKSILEGDK